MKGLVLAMTWLSILVVACPAWAGPPRPDAGGLLPLDSTMLDVLDAATVLSPSPSDYTNNYVEAAGASGLRVRVKSNVNTGLSLFIRCADPSPQILFSDFLVRTQTAPGSGGSTLSTYTNISGSNQLLWSTHVDQNQWQTVTTDVRIRNIGNYDTSGSSGQTNYTNTLTYTVISL